MEGTASRAYTSSSVSETKQTLRIEKDLKPRLCSAEQSIVISSDRCPSQGVGAAGAARAVLAYLPSLV